MKKQRPVILIVEDEKIARDNLAYILKKEGHETVLADNGEEALERLKSATFDLVITDLKMEKLDGLAVLKASRQLQPHTEVILVTAYATVDTAVKALKEGAYHYITKPYKIDEIRKLVNEALLKRELILENSELKRSLYLPDQIPYLIGKSRAIQDLKKNIGRIAPSDSNVVIIGESGTGKELAARAIHQLSDRSMAGFVAFNCGSFTEELMANELFGHEKGAYTGAVKEKRGLIETADKGTVFLDEVGDMPLSMQVKLLRVIEEQELYRVGGVEAIPIDVRFLAATHRDLKTDIESGRFRKDLYYRLNVVTLYLPPLTERDGDIELLANHFLAQKSQTMNKKIEKIEKEAMDLLTGYSWPGNVRELDNVIESAVAMGSGTAITVGDLPPEIRNLSIETYRMPHSRIPTLEEQEKRYLRWVLEKCNGNKTKAARLMGLDRVSLWRKLKRFDIDIGK